MIKPQHIATLVVLSIFFSLVSCSESLDDECFVVGSATPGPIGEMSDDMDIDSQSIGMIFDKFDQQSQDVDDFDELASLYERRQLALARHVVTLLPMRFTLDVGVPSHVVRLPMAGLDKQLFSDESLFLKLNSITPETIRNGKKRPVETD